MKQFIRVIISMLSIITLLSEVTQASEIDQNPEILPRQFIKIEIPQPSSASLAPMDMIQEMATTLPHAKSFSLLIWKQKTREELSVESYNRTHHFGRWINDKRDKVCHNTRAKVLIRDSDKPVVFKPDNRCTVESGEWNDPFSKTVLTDAILEVQVDHLVPLKNAYVAGAHAWDFRTRCLYANYLGTSYHLKPIEAEENLKKSDHSPTRYLPSNKEYRCTYLKNWLLVKTAWNLELTVKEASAIKKIMLEEDCNPQQFQISANEINEHRRFFKNNLDLCPIEAPAAE